MSKKWSLTSNAAWGSSSIKASEKHWKNLPGKQRLQQSSLTKEGGAFKINNKGKGKHAPLKAQPLVSRDVIRDCECFSGSRVPDGAWILAIFSLSTRMGRDSPEVVLVLERRPRKTVFLPGRVCPSVCGPTFLPSRLRRPRTIFSIRKHPRQESGLTLSHCCFIFQPSWPSPLPPFSGPSRSN
uniref:Uncharacterized protein n=1 Tax=Marmota marmota marmota TaxID=9994 RepID=A0A8C5YK79_MARMA